MNYINAYRKVHGHGRVMHPVMRTLFISLLFIISVIITALFSAPLPVMAAQPFELHLLDVCQGQSVLVEADGEYMLIDGGGRDTSSFVVSYLQQEGVETFDFIAASHYDEDHMAGLIGALKVFPAETLLLPSYEYDSELFSSFSEAALTNGCDITHPQAGDSYQMGSAQIAVEGPLNSDYPDENDNSLALKITYGSRSFLICGDAQEMSETDMAMSGEDLTSDVYVADHHGSATSSTDIFLDAVAPSYTLISCGSGNSYGHPAAEALSRIQDHGSELFRTDLQGTIIAYSDGTDIWFDTEPCNDWTPGDPSEAADQVLSGSQTDTAEAGSTAGGTAGDTSGGGSTAGGDTIVDEAAQHSYVCNKNTMKFHYPDCDSVAQMSEKNRVYTDLSRDELIAQGYSPCGNCRP